LEQPHPAQAGGTPAPRAVAPPLETERLLLRPWRPEDVSPYALIIRDREVMRYLGAGLGYGVKRMGASLLARVSEMEARRAIASLIRHWSRHGYGEWAVEEKATGALLGNIGLKYQPDWVAEPARVEIGWLLARGAWGRGLASEGARAGVAFAFESRGIDRVISIAVPENRRSVRVMERIGLELQGQTRWRGGEVVWYAIDRGAWNGGTQGACATSS
jgi:RimJ/RimL family protein N-acetyltransferase